MNSFGFGAALLAQAAGDAAQEAAVQAQPAAGSPLGWQALLIVASVVIIPFAIGHFLARSIKMKDAAFRIGVVLFALTLAVAPFVSNFFRTGSFIEGVFNLGIDLAGGTNLLYQVDREKAAALGKTVDGGTMDKLVEGVARRVNPSGTEEVTVRRVGEDRVEVIVPGADQERTEAVKRNIVSLGSLEFTIVVNQQKHPELYERGREMLDDPSQKVIRNASGEIVARWVPVAFDDEGNPKLTVDPGMELQRPATVRGKEGVEVLVLNEPNERDRITGRFLVNAQERIEPRGRVVAFNFNSEGGSKFYDLTVEYQSREGEHAHKLAIVLNDEIHSAPVVNEPISTSGTISGRFTAAEVRELVNVLNAGALEVPLKPNPVSEFTVSPLLGQDVQEAGTRALIIASVTVFLFMLLYYWKAGVVADICLLVNVALVLGVMAMIDATLTLPGLAGLVLVIGMAVDANVLIFERIREELNKGSSLRMGIHNGFDKALSTIVDANLTTLITAIVLYVIGTDQVKGFAVTLFIGIVCSMFTALYLGKLIFDILERMRLLHSLPMASIVGTTRINFVGKARASSIVSGIVILVGMAGVFTRGPQNFDIDFSGGVMVTFQFDEAAEIPTVDQARELLREKLGDDITVEQLTQETNGEEERLVRLRTTEDDVDKVTAGINAAFEGSPYRLVRQDVRDLKIEPLVADTEADPEQENQFAGGQQATFSVEEAMLPESVKEEVLVALASLDKERYREASELIEVRVDEDEPEEAGGKRHNFVVRARPVVTAADFEQALTQMQADLEANPFFFEKNTFDSQVGREMQMTALLAIVISLAAIVLYLWFRFQGVTFGLAAIVALVHDVLVVLGLTALASFASGNAFGSMLGLMDFKINLPMVAAFLTIVGYSLNDTIVVFDRIREIRGKNPRLTSEMVNASVNQTLSRTLLTSLTTLIVVGILYVLGGEGIHGFAFCLMMGIIVGTYSSIYIASPVLLWLTNRSQPQATRTATATAA